MNPVALLLAAAQGARLRRATEILPPAAGPTGGVVPGPGDSAAVRLLVIGDSTAAGVGAANHEEAIAGSLARLAAEDVRAAVQWRVIAQSGATSRRVRHSLLPELEGSDPFDLAVVLVGVNDVLARRHLDQWQEDVAAVLAGVTARAGLVVMTGLPPFDRFPSMPRTLGRYLTGRGRRLDEVAERLCRDEEQVLWIDSAGLLADDAEFFARDGFHPSATGYQRWAHAIWQRTGTELVPPAGFEPTTFCSGGRRSIH